MATRGIEAGPALTDDRIKALKTHIHALLKMLKKAYDEAKVEGAAEQLRVDADRCVQQFQDAVEATEREVQNSTSNTENVRFNAQNLLTELKVFRDAVGEKYPRLTSAEKGGETHPPTEQGGEAGAKTTEVGGGGAVANAVSVLEGRGEARKETFALPKGPPSTPRTPRGKRANSAAINESTISIGGEKRTAKKTGAAGTNAPPCATLNPKTTGAQTSFQSLASTLNATTTGTTETQRASLDTTTSTVVGGDGENEESAPTPENGTIPKKRQGAGGRAAPSRASTTSHLSTQATEERDKDVAIERKRRREERLQEEARIAEMAAELEKMRKDNELKEKMSQKKIEAIDQGHEEVQKMLEEEEGERPNLEYTTQGLGLDEEEGAEEDQVLNWVLKTRKK